MVNIFTFGVFCLHEQREPPGKSHLKGEQTLFWSEVSLFCCKHSFPFPPIFLHIVWYLLFLEAFNLLCLRAKAIFWWIVDRFLVLSSPVYCRFPKLNCDRFCKSKILKLHLIFIDALIKTMYFDNLCQNGDQSKFPAEKWDTWRDNSEIGEQRVISEL